ncbi:unnamed protein product [Paramecium sonneborni]|uniref:Uncharacterized protein n=1 Tax=Paramecium sonneborni TaxID=65129 RepID=A0A8S1RP76_9CILI|nr:unnamed protein product [Paramecium sonneborni]
MLEKDDYSSLQRGVLFFSPIRMYFMNFRRNLQKICMKIGH